MLLIHQNVCTKMVSSNHTHGGMYSMPHHMIKCVSDLRQVVVLSGYSGFLRHDITEILLKVALNTITLSPNPQNL